MWGLGTKGIAGVLSAFRLMPWETTVPSNTALTAVAFQPRVRMVLPSLPSRLTLFFVNKGAPLLSFNS